MELFHNTKTKNNFFFKKMILIFPSPNFRILKFEDLAVMRKTIGNVDLYWTQVIEIQYDLQLNDDNLRNWWQTYQME